MIILLDGISVFVTNWQLIAGMLIFFFVITIPYLLSFKLPPTPASISMGIILALFIFLSLLLRLAYISKALFPSYFDSAAHYMIIKNIIANDLSWIFDSMRANYYHMGFHLITAFFTFVIQVEISTVILVFGQIILTLLPFPFYFIVKHKTRSNWAGMFAAILSAFGWYMPAHAVDWGKYPALLSSYLIIPILGLAYSFVQKKDTLQIGKRIFTLVTLGVGILFTTFVHSRSVIVLGMFAIAWVVSLWWGRRSQPHRHWIFLALLIALVFEVIIIQRYDVLQLLLDPYIKQGVLVTSLVALLSIFAYKKFPQLTFINLMTISLLLVSLFIPVKELFTERDHLTLMDRPYVEMILFMPLSILGGLGLAGFEKRIKSLYRSIVGIVIGWVLIYGIVNHDFSPAECCVIVGDDDVAAMAWMVDQLPVDARIGVASTALKVVVDDVVEGDVGADAGIWITPLIERRTYLLPHDSEFDQQPILDFLCAKRIDYLFVGELGQTFDVARLDLRPGWYRPLLSMPRTRVYEVIGCDG
ncbi:MAG TPA: DUF6541 family protein [Anaerolineales bacterium]|nr:DUF6541 family protein [Anaerolineales bacterium]